MYWLVSFHSGFARAYLLGKIPSLRFINPLSSYTFSCCSFHTCS
jgi:hypothetical protein